VSSASGRLRTRLPGAGSDPQERGPGRRNDHVRSLASVAYVVLGVLVASEHNYYTHLATVAQVVSAVVATALWPLIVLGASLHLNLGQL
jgi:hypothetical protein